MAAARSVGTPWHGGSRKIPDGGADRTPNGDEYGVPCAITASGVIRSAARGPRRILCALPTVVGRSVDFTKYVGPLTASRHLQGVPAVAPHVEYTRRSILVVVFESEWTVLVFARWCSDVRQRKLMWRLPARLRENLTTMGVDQLVLDSDFPLPVVQQ